MERWTGSVIVTARHREEVDQFSDHNGEALWRGEPVQCSTNALNRDGPVQCIAMRHCADVDLLSLVVRHCVEVNSSV